MNTISQLWEKVFGTSETKKKVHDIKNEFTSEMLNISREARQITKASAKRDEKLETTALKIYRATQGDKKWIH